MYFMLKYDSIITIMSETCNIQQQILLQCLNFFPDNGHLTEAVVFLGPLRQILEQRIKTGHNRLLSHSSQFTVYMQRLTGRMSRD